MKSDEAINQIRSQRSAAPGSRRRSAILAGAAAIGLACGSMLGSSVANAQQQQARPNILVIFGDDIGQSNISAYSHGLVGYKTPNIDRIAKEGMMFTDYYAENSCTAGRSTFITGQVCLRKLRIYELPISYYGRTHDEGKKITWRDGFRALWVLVRVRISG